MQVVSAVPIHVYTVDSAIQILELAAVLEKSGLRNRSVSAIALLPDKVRAVVDIDA
jgi:hypothetical protein